MEFAYNNGYQASIGMAPYEALFGKACRTPLCWNEVGERQLIGPEIIDVTTEKVGDRVLLKISPWKGVMIFGKKGKLSPRYIGPYEIIARVGEVAYKLAVFIEEVCIRPFTYSHL